LRIKSSLSRHSTDVLGRKDSGTDPGAFTWIAHTYEDLPGRNGFHFTLYYKTEDGVGGFFDSGALVMVDDDDPSVASTMSGSSMSTPGTHTPTPSPFTSSSSTASASTTPGAATSSSTNPAPADDSRGGDKKTLEVGLGVGLGIGIPFLLLVGGLLGFMCFRRQGESPPAEVPTYEQAGDVSRQDQKAAEVGAGLLPELNGDVLRHEMPGEKEVMQREM
jgi:hypothetical protein